LLAFVKGERWEWALMWGRFDFNASNKALLDTALFASRTKWRSEGIGYLLV
jgi:hypothetical protein